MVALTYSYAYTKSTQANRHTHSYTLKLLLENGPTLLYHHWSLALNCLATTRASTSLTSHFCAGTCVEQRCHTKTCLPKFIETLLHKDIAVSSVVFKKCSFAPTESNMFTTRPPSTTSLIFSPPSGLTRARRGSVLVMREWPLLKGAPLWYCAFNPPQTFDFKEPQSTTVVFIENSMYKMFVRDWKPLQ